MPKSFAVDVYAIASSNASLALPINPNLIKYYARYIHSYPTSSVYNLIQCLIISSAFTVPFNKFWLL
jgi:hypothetical protein